MPRRLNLPDTASTAEAGADGRLCAPSAARNAAPISALLSRTAPRQGRALELASGTGQHVVAFAAACPGLTWQPSEVDPARLHSIAQWVALAPEGGTILPAIPLDATAPGWGARHGGQDLIVVVNLLHLISGAEAQTLLAEAAQALAPGGQLVIYGPFLRGGQATSPGDAAFHAGLRAQDPEIGYKDVDEITARLTGAGLRMVDTAEMPANNLALCAERPG